MILYLMLLEKQSELLTHYVYFIILQVGTKIYCFEDILKCMHLSKRDYDLYKVQHYVF